MTFVLKKLYSFNEVLMKKLLFIAVLFISTATQGYYPQPLGDTPPEDAERGVIALEFRYSDEWRPYLVGTTTPYKNFWVQYSTNLVEWKTLPGAVSSPKSGELQVLVLMDPYPPICFFRLISAQ